MLRKNRNVDSRCSPLTGGVDLNRNYGYRWGMDNDGSDTDPCTDAYRGKAPFSEPETQAIRNWIIGNTGKYLIFVFLNVFQEYS
jgi:carboxypeptidase T